MRPPKQLPPWLRRRAFTRAQLLAVGLPDDRLQRQDIVPLGSGTFALRQLVDDADPNLRLRLRALALAREFPHGWLSHCTAARLLDRCAVPLSCSDRAVHISVPRQAPVIARTGVRCHRVRAAEAEVVELPGLPGVRISSPARLWREVASSCTAAEAVELGDSLVREPYPWAEQRSEPYTSISTLEASVRSTAGFRGRRTALQALPLIRVGADSPRETAFRLALLRAGLPEPSLQIPLDPADPTARRGDMGYREWKIVIQYDGGHHYTPQRHRSDQRRDNEWGAAGWLTLRINVRDDREGFLSAVSQVAAALRSRGCPL